RPTVEVGPARLAEIVNAVALIADQTRRAQIAGCARVLAVHDRRLVAAARERDRRERPHRHTTAPSSRPAAENADRPRQTRAQLTLAARARNDSRRTAIALPLRPTTMTARKPRDAGYSAHRHTTIAPSPRGTTPSLGGESSGSPTAKMTPPPPPAAPPSVHSASARVSSRLPAASSAGSHTPPPPATLSDSDFACAPK